jgi:hypothetical protein
MPRKKRVIEKRIKETDSWTKGFPSEKKSFAMKSKLEKDFKTGSKEIILKTEGIDKSLSFQVNPCKR